jgi:hypothetical protein
MASSNKPNKQPATGGLQDFSHRYRGAEQVQGSGGWFEFTEVGHELVGEYQGMQPFRNGMKGSLTDTEGKPYVFSVPTLLQDQLKAIEVGTKVAIVLVGFQPSKKTSPLKVFQVFRLPS